jgi:COP9 signalosome complex subunit 6
VKNVHKKPPLDLVGWYTLVPKTGPTSDHLPIHEQILKAYNESAILLGFHTEDVLHPVAGDPLPLTIYESNLEAEDSKDHLDQTEDEDREMKDSEAPAKMVLKFKELPFTTETGEAEMIAMQFIREGGANAMAVEQSTAKNTKGKQPAGKEANLSKEQAEYISALQAKANAIKMMRARVSLVIKYLQGLPSDSGTGEQANPGGLSASNNILRQIQALITNVELVTPTQQNALEKELLQESNDVMLVTLVKELMSSITDVRDVGKKFAIMESSKAQKSRASHFDLSAAAGHMASLGSVGDIHIL